MKRFVKRNFLWFFYTIFVALAFLYSGGNTLIYKGEYASGQYLIWLTYLCFLAYSIKCSRKESFFKSVKVVNSLYWGRQIGVDLYISVFLSLTVIYLNEGSLFILMIWFVPVVIFANLAILLYVALNYGSLIAHFV